MDEFLKELEQLLKKYKVTMMCGGYGGEVEINSDKFYTEVSVSRSFQNEVTFEIHKKEELK